jgi:hypothetical protein
VTSMQNSCASRLYLAAVILLITALSACATGLVRHSFSFDAREEPGVEILDYRYGSSRQPGARADQAQLRGGRIRQAVRMSGDIRRPDLLYVRWRDMTTQVIYEDTVDLGRLLPRDITDHRIHFTVKGSQLLVYLVTPQWRRAGEPVNGPMEYQAQKVITLSANYGHEVSSQ